MILLNQLPRKQHIDSHYDTLRVKRPKVKGLHKEATKKMLDALDRFECSFWNNLFYQWAFFICLVWYSLHLCFINDSDLFSEGKVEGLGCLKNTSHKNLTSVSIC